ncbi:DivIVA domain-containing protein [Leuconostoc rapi]|uniref:DivIVA domain-containing protein n=1 Tax=Leuconostoc rapi TaxID=1406906 RepID=UPI001956EE71|nr:DivIVA domain-containing protein [Leuconostoc rapi]
MLLTPDEILNHEFTKKGSRAYIASEVDAFLDTVNSDYETLIAERDKLHNDNSSLQARVDELEAKREQVNQSIFVAQEAADRLKQEADVEVKKQLTHAQESATKIISDARTKAESEASNLAQENADLIDEQNQLRTEVENFKNSFLKLLTLQRKLIENDELAEAVHHLPLGEATAKRVDHVATNDDVLPDVEDQQQVVSETTDDTTTEAKPASGPVVVFPESEENSNDNNK